MQALVRVTLRWLREAGGLRVWALYMPGPGPLLMSWLRKRWVLFRNPRANIEFRGPVYVGPGFSLHAPHGGTFTVGAGVEFRRGFRAELGAGGRIEIGAMCCFTYDVILSCTTSIEIADNATLAQGCYVVDGSHRFRDLDRPIMKQGYDYRPIRIGSGVLINSKCTIASDVGERAVVGAHSLVLAPVAPYCLAGGVPAEVLDYFGPDGGDPRSASTASSAG